MLYKYGLEECIKCLKEYFKQYPKDRGGIDECADEIIIDSKKLKQSFIPPSDESPEKFMNRLERSRKAGRNLFYEEWNPFQYPDDADC